VVARGVGIGIPAMRRRKVDVAAVPAKVAGGLDDRFQAATPLRNILNKVFPDHWSFLLGEIAPVEPARPSSTGTCEQPQSTQPVVAGHRQAG
jgi:hypothetical protein